MINKLFKVITITLILIPTVIVGQTPPPLGAASCFVLFTSVGATTNGVFSQITGNVGTNDGAFSGFGNINGQVHVGDAVSAQCVIDLGIADTLLRAQIPGATIGPVIGAGQILLPNVYLLPAAASVTDTLILDGGGDEDACFVFQIGGALTTAAGASIKLINGTKACNVFWQVNGAFSLATNTSFKGTIISGGAISLAVGCSLEGRGLSVVGAVSVSALTAGIPIGCGSPIITECDSPSNPGPVAPNMKAISCFALLTSSGTVTNMGTTNVVGHVGTNNGSASGFDPVYVVGDINSVPHAHTADGSSDLNTLYTYLNGLPSDIELSYPVLFGYSQVLTPNVYVMNAAAMLTDTIFLDARGVVDAVFVIRILGALTTGPSPQVVLVGGTQSNNVFWQVEGAVTISSSGSFGGIIVAHNGDIILNTGVTLNGKALSTRGHITTHDVNVTSIICSYPLPIELLNFTAEVIDSHVQLNWTTASENNNDYFNIEKSSDGIIFNSIYTINGAGNSTSIINYSAVDNDPSEGSSYYRLKQTDYNGDNSYSELVAIEFKSNNDFIFNIYPNPNNGEEINLQITANNNEEIFVIIHDRLGKEIYSKIIVTSINGSHVYTLDHAPKLNSGVYFITATSGMDTYKKTLLVIPNN